MNDDDDDADNDDFGDGDEGRWRGDDGGVARMILIRVCAHGLHACSATMHVH